MKALFILLVFATSAGAATNGYKCKEAGLQQEMNACAEDTFAAVDKELNKAYKSLKASLNKSQRKELVKDEKAWLDYLDLSCRAAANDEAEGGSMWPMVFWQCKADKSKARVETLRNWKR